ELIERGHVYIAQPPLYKVKRGKTEVYVKDDAELNALLLRHAVEEATLYTGQDGSAIQGETLEQLAREYMEAKAIIERWGKRYDPNVLHALMWLPSISSEQLEDAEHMRDWTAKLEERLKALNGAGPRYRVHYQPGGTAADPVIYLTREYHGVTTTKQLQPGFFRSPEYQRIVTIGASFKDLLSPGAYVLRGNERKEVATFPEAVEWMMAQAKKGQTIQRYKGLGEMNPEQLWETTVNPKTRRLMQVRIEDAVAADEIFSTLMGDQVEPRREFIERNALLAF